MGPCKGGRNATTIGTLQDDLLLEIFDQYRKNDDKYNLSYRDYCAWKWHILAHICRRWRQIVFASPGRLDLQVLCTYGTPISEIMGAWPTIPITISFSSGNGLSNVITALEHPNRVSRINVCLFRSHWGNIAALMQEPFPMLTHLSIAFHFRNESTIPDGLFRGSALLLQHLDLRNVSFPALQTFLLSASNLVNLSIRRISRTGYISPEVMALHVATLPKLEILDIEFSDMPFCLMQSCVP